jgi:hypothetical protein
MPSLPGDLSPTNVTLDFTIAMLRNEYKIMKLLMYMITTIIWLYSPSRAMASPFGVS